MAQSGYTPISLYFSATGAAVPTAGNLVAGELALNTNDGKLYFKNSAGVVTLLAGSTSGPAGGSNTQVQYNNSGVLAGITGATTNGTALTLVAPVLGTPASATLTLATGLPISTGVSGLGTGIATALAVNVGTAGAPVVNGGALGSPSSVGTMPAFTLGGTVSGGGNQINNVVIGTTTPLAGSFTTLSATGVITSTVAGSSNVFVNTSGGTGYLAIVTNNAVGGLITGVETNAGGTLIIGSTGNDGAVRGKTGIAFSANDGLGMQMRLSSTGLAVTGTLSATGTLSGGTSGTAYSFSGSAPATSLTLGSSGNVSAGSTISHGKIGSFLSDANTTFSSLGYGMLSLMNSSSTNNNYTWMTFNESNQNYVGAIGTQNINHSGPSGSVYGDLLFATKTNGLGGFPTEKMRLDSNGNLGIGFTSPAQKLHVSGAIVSVNGVSDYPSNADYCVFTYTSNNGSGVYPFNSNGNLVIQPRTSAARDIVFATGSTTPTTRAVIDSSGNFLVGTTTPRAQITADFNGSSTNGIALNDTASAGGTVFSNFFVSGTSIGSITRVGSTSAVAFNTTSDYRLKTVTGTVTGQGTRIDALNPVDYLWKDGGQQARGFLAHEFQTVYPNSVTGDKDAVDADGNPKHQSMQASSSEVIADLVAELQSLRARVAQLESKP